VSKTSWPAACPRCGGDVVRLAYLEDHPKGQAPRRQFRCWRCHVPLEQVLGGGFQVAVEVGRRASSRGKLSTW
jgi:hypothetical protein